MKPVHAIKLCHFYIFFSKEENVFGTQASTTHSVQRTDITIFRHGRKSLNSLLPRYRPQR